LSGKETITKTFFVTRKSAAKIEEQELLEHLEQK
jgi:hypothetical protein